MLWKGREDGMNALADLIDVDAKSNTAFFV
jgi:hypothetical protein